MFVNEKIQKEPISQSAKHILNYLVPKTIPQIANNNF